MQAMAQSRSFSAAWRAGGVVWLACAVGALSAAKAQAADEPALDLPRVPAAALPADDNDSLLARVAAEVSAPVGDPALQVVELSGRLDPDAAHPFTDARGSRELAGVSYRVWMTRGRARVGLGFGALGRTTATPPDGSEPAPRTLAEAAPVVSLAMRYRLGEHSAVFADASLAHALAGTEGLGDYANAKVGVEWKAAKPRLGFERGRLGLQLDSGYRMSFRIRKSGLGVYLRGNF